MLSDVSDSPDQPVLIPNFTIQNIFYFNKYALLKNGGCVNPNRPIKVDKYEFRVDDFDNISDLQEKDDLITEYKDGLLSKDCVNVAELFNGSIERFVNETTSWPGLENYRTKLKEFHATFFQKCRGVYVRNQTGFNVLNHGDFHFKNTMYKFVGEELEDVAFVSTIETCFYFFILYLFFLISIICYKKNTTFIPLRSISN